MSIFKKTTHVEGVICDKCGIVYDKVTNRMSEYCECGCHLWSGDPNTKTYMVDEANATPCMVKVTSYLGGIVTIAQHEYDIEYVPSYLGSAIAMTPAECDGEYVPVTQDA